MYKKVSLFLLILLSSFALFSCTKKDNNAEEETEDTYDVVLDNYIDKLMETTPSFVPSWNKEGFKNRWNYIDGVFLKSLIDLYKKTNNERYLNFVIKYVDYYIDENGNFVAPDTSRTNDPFLAGELDSICESKILFDLYEYTNKQKYKTAIEFTKQALCAIPQLSNDINYSHKAIYPNQVWLDGMYMYAPFDAAYQGILPDNADSISEYNLLHDAYSFIRNHMFNETKKLYYHGYDDSEEKIFWADDITGCSKSFWSRSMGWYIASLIDVIEKVPENDDNRTYFINLFKEAIEGVLQYKEPKSNMFYQVLDRGGEGTIVPYKNYLLMLTDLKEDTYIENYLESSGSSLFAYSILKACNLNVLDSSYKKIGEDIFFGVYNHSFKDNKLNDICITAGLGPKDKRYRDGSFEYYLAEPVGSNDAKGVGPFIMAYIQLK